MKTPAFDLLCRKYLEGGKKSSDVLDKARAEIQILKEVLALGKVMRDFQKLFYKLRKKVNKKDHDSLLHQALQSEIAFDEAIDNLISSKEKQQSLL